MNDSSQSPVSNFQARLRPDLRAIADLVPAKSKVLDLGCGEGDLLEYLIHEKQVQARGIELIEACVLACVRRGLSVRQGNLAEGLADYPDRWFDLVVLSQTLPYLDDPTYILNEMLRVGESAIVSFSNWGYWRCRLELLVIGRIPQAPDLPQSWYDSPRWQAFTLADFAKFTRSIDISISKQVYLANGRISPIRKFKNLMATTAVFQLERV